MDFIKITEQESNHKDLEKKTVFELVNAMHEEDNNALKAVHNVLPKVVQLIEEIEPKIKLEYSLFFNTSVFSFNFMLQPNDTK